MNIDAAVTELERKLGKPRNRAAHGQWVPYAWIVRGLVERGHEVSESVRVVLAKSKIKCDPVVAEKSLRAAYYKVKPKPWPKEQADMVAGATPEPEDDAFGV